MMMSLRQILHFLHDIVGACPEEAKNGYEKDSAKVEMKMKGGVNANVGTLSSSSSFQMPLHYPRYKKGDYEKMEEWRLDNLLQQYGLCFEGDLEDKRAFAMGAFLWPDQLSY